MIVNDAVVGVPSVHILVHHRAIPKLNHAHAALDQPSGHQALAAERLAYFVVQAVKAPGLIALRIDIDGLRSAALHAERQFVRADTRRKLADPRMGLDIVFVHARQLIQLRALLLESQRSRWRMEIQDRIARGAEPRLCLRAACRGTSRASACSRTYLPGSRRRT